MTGTNSVEEQLKAEIKKWMEKLGKAIDQTKAMSPKGVDFLTNIKAYQSDSLHFYNKGDLVRSFEALIYAWGILETAVQTGDLQSKPL